MGPLLVRKTGLPRLKVNTVSEKEAYWTGPSPDLSRYRK
jgi:hypothetical protein